MIDVIETLKTTASLDDKSKRRCCWPERKLWRYLGLGCICFLGFGSFFCYDCPAALQNNMIDDLGINTTQFVLLYSIYAWPNIVMCFIGGFLLDRVFGIRLGAIIFISLATLGQLIFAAGATWNMFWIMILGRSILGIGAESLCVATMNYTILWFKGKKLNTIIGLFTSSIQLSSSVSLLVIEPIYKHVSKRFSGPERIGIVLFLASLVCVLTIISACLLALMDWRNEKLNLSKKVDQPKNITKLSVAKDFKGIFWLVVVISIIPTVTIYPFVSLGKVFFMEKYSFSAAAANTVNSSLYTISTIAAPLCGFIIDKTGRNVSWLIVSIIGTAIAHGMLTFTYVNPYVCMVTMGISYSMLLGSSCPLIAFIVPEYQLGTAYGITMAARNLGSAIVPIFIGIIVEKLGYFSLGIFYLTSLCVALVTSIVLWISDKKTFKGSLNMIQSERRIHDTEHQTIDPEKLPKD